MSLTDENRTALLYSIRNIDKIIILLQNIITEISMAFERLKAGWALARSVRSMVSNDRRLLIYPLVSGVIGIILFAGSFLGALFIPVNIQTHWRMIIGLVIAYVVTGFVSTYFLVAMLIAFKSFESGEVIGMGKALSMTRPYSGKILLWAIFYTILVMILRVIESRFRGVSQVIVAVIGSLGITVATFFAIPAILEKKVGPIDAVKESVATIRRTIGPIFGGVAYIDLYTMIFALSGIVIAFAGFIVAMPIVLKAAVIVIGVALLAIGMILNYTYFNILKLLIYDYFNGGKLPSQIDETVLQNAIKRKQGRRNRFQQV